MKFFVLNLTLAMAILIQSCTGQKPASLKNSTTPRDYVKASCSRMAFEGQVLSKKNILNIFECSGWAKQYPDLTTAIQNVNQESFDQSFKVINDQFFSSKSQRKDFFELIATAEKKGELKNVALVLEKSLLDHKLLTQLDKILTSKHVTQDERSSFMQLLSSSQEENIRIVRALKNITKAYEIYKPVINGLLTEADKEKLIDKVVLLVSDLTTKLEAKDWGYVSEMIYKGDSPLRNWATEGMDGNLKVLLDVVENPGFFKDSVFLKNSLDTGITCGNRASQREFNINIGQELKHKIEGLKELDKEPFEKMLLHGMTKYLAFQEFCEEKEKQQGVKAFYQILNHAFNVLPSHHDFTFLKRLHQIFGEDRFVFLSFLSSDTFSSLRDLLIDLKQDGRDLELVHKLYSLLNEMSDEDLKSLAGLVKDVATDGSQTQSWEKSLAKIWSGMESQDQKDLVRFLGVLLDEKIQSSDLLNIVEAILVKFPEFSPAIASDLKNKGYQNSLTTTLASFTDSKVQNDLSHLLSNDGLFEFISILTQEYKPQTESTVESQERQNRPSPYVQTLQSSSSVQTRVCFENLSKRYESDSSYYNLVNTLPEECLNVLGQAGFVGRIYLWMNSSNAYFKEHYQVGDFHSATGVWAPGMLQFIFTAAVKADFSLLSDSGAKGILPNIDEIHRVVTDSRLLEVFHQFSGLYKEVDQKLDVDQKILTFVNSKNDQELNQFFKNGIDILTDQSPHLSYDIKPTSCKNLSDSLGTDPCLTNEKLVTGVTDILRILKRKNEKGNSLARELVNWIHPKSGIDLPFRKPKNRTHHTSIDELIRYFYDLSNDKTSKEFVYQTSESEEKVNGNVIDRLEVVIRDIGFMNNFYGAYFKNEIAGATVYRKKVEDSEKLLVLLDSSSGVFRSVDGLPKDSKYKLKNIRETYSSLSELDNKYEQPDGSEKSYGPFIQSLLAAITSSSKLSTQKFNAYRIPNEKKTVGHNGEFLTQIVNLSGLRHVSQFVRARFNDDLSALNTEAFKEINTNLIARHDVKKVHSGIETLLGKYLDNDKSQLNMMVQDGIDFVSALDSHEQKMLEEILLKGMILLSKKEISTANIEELAGSIDLMVQMWPEIRDVLLKVEDKKELLQTVDHFLTKLISHPEELNGLIQTVLKSDLVHSDDIKSLLQDPVVREKFAKMINQITKLNNFESSLNWSQVLKAILSSDMQWESLKTWFQTALGEEKDKLTVSLLIEFLGEKKDDKYRLSEIMDELFMNHRPDLEQFLRETFKSLELKPE